MKSEIPKTHIISSHCMVIPTKAKLAERKWRAGEGEREDMGKRQEQELLVLTEKLINEISKSKHTSSPVEVQLIIKHLKKKTHKNGDPKTDSME